MKKFIGNENGEIRIVRNRKIKINWYTVLRNLLVVTIVVYSLWAASYINETNKYIEDRMFQIENLEKEIETVKAEKQELLDEIALSELEVKNTQYLSCVEKHSGTFKVTAYCSCVKCCGKWATINGGGVTASGTKVKEGRTIAVYKNQIPFGTEVHIEGMGTYIAEDTGSAIKENCIDIYFDSHEEALKFGVKYLKVEY